MTGQQKASVILLLYNSSVDRRPEVLNTEVKNFGISEREQQSEKGKVMNLFNLGIKNLNLNHLKNLLKFINENNFSTDEIKRKLAFYEIDPKYYENILQFFHDYHLSNHLIDVSDLDNQFKGVQVASRDNFNTIINQGWTGDWILTPDNIEPRRVQIASMNDKGNFPRGYYINADIIDIQPIVYGEQIRYRVFIANSVIINTGNRNVKFNLNPVKYIK